MNKPLKFWRFLFNALVLMIISGHSFSLAQAQTYTLEMTGSLYANSIPHMAADVSALVRVNDKLHSYTRLEFRPLTPGQIAHSTSTGIEYTLFTSPKLDMNSMVQAGVATGPDTTSGVFTGGGNLVIKPSWTKGFQFVIAGEMVSSPTLGGSEPQIRFGFRYPLISQ